MTQIESQVHTFMTQTNPNKPLSTKYLKINAKDTNFNNMNDYKNQMKTLKRKTKPYTIEKKGLKL